MFNSYVSLPEGICLLENLSECCVITSELTNIHITLGEAPACSEMAKKEVGPVKTRVNQWKLQFHQQKCWFSHSGHGDERSEPQVILTNRTCGFSKKVNIYDGK